MRFDCRSPARIFSCRLRVRRTNQSPLSRGGGADASSACAGNRRELLALQCKASSPSVPASVPDDPRGLQFLAGFTPRHDTIVTHRVGRSDVIGTPAVLRSTGTGTSRIVSVLPNLLFRL